MRSCAKCGLEIEANAKITGCSIANCPELGSAQGKVASRLTDQLGEIERVRQACYDAGISCDAVMDLARSAASSTAPMPEGFERCPIGLDSSPTFCSAGTCTPCRAWHYYYAEYMHSTDSSK